MTRLLVKSMSLAALLVVTVGSGSIAFAHGGDHAHMSIAELVTHLSTSFDHKSAIVAVGGAFAFAAALVLLTGKKRAR
jgi:hypothetical protein